MRVIAINGVAQRNILLYGHSLGGAVAAAMGKEFPDTSIVNDRSFSSLDAVIKAFICIPIFREFMAWAVSQTWNLDSYENMKENHGLVKKIVVAHQDLIIDFEDASLYSSYIKNHSPLPETMHLRYHINPLNSITDRLNDYAMTHCYDIPPSAFKDFINPWLTA